MNSQKPLKSTEDLSRVAVHSIFYTIQGEGPFSGTPAIFVRLYGCNLACPLCDTDYTSRLANMSVWEVVLAVKEKFPYNLTTEKLVVITGGEPFRQKSLTSLVQILLSRGFSVQIETNGTLFLPLPFKNPKLTIGCSPKTTVNARLIPYITYYKYVMGTGRLKVPSGLPFNSLNHPVGPEGVYTPDFLKVRPENIYIQPEDSVKNRDDVIDRIVKICLQKGYKISLQLHKLLNLE